MVDFAVGVELFCIIFFSLLWLVTPEKVEGTTKDSPILIIDNEEVESEVICDDKEFLEVENDPQNDIFNLISEKITFLQVTEIREIAKILGISRYQNRRRVSKSILIERIKQYLEEKVEWEEKVLSEISQRLKAI